MLMPALLGLGREDSITFVGREPGLSFIRDHVDDSRDIESHIWHNLFTEGTGCLALPIAGVELAIAFFRDKNGNIQSNLRSVLPGIDVHVFPSFPPKERDVHVGWYVAECLKIAGLSIKPDRALNAAFRYGLLEGGVVVPRQKERIVIHPGSGDRKKNHPPDFFLELTDNLAKKEKTFSCLSPIFLLGPAEESLFGFFRKRQRSAQIDVIICPDKVTLMGLFRSTSLYIGHDSGISHLAAMLGAPTIALFKDETAVRQWRPLGPFVEVITRKVSDSELMQDITEASQRLLAGTSSRSFQNT